MTMYFEPFDKYLDALRKWDGSSQKPRSIYERALIQSRDLLPDGDRNYVLVPGMGSLLTVLKNGEKLSVVNLDNIDLDSLRALYNGCLSEITQPWIDLCFFEEAGVIHYDSFYDSLPIGAGIDTTIKQLLENLEHSTACLLCIPDGSTLAVADAEVFQKPLRYLLQQRGIKTSFYDSSSSIPDTVIEPSIVNLKLITACGSFAPCIGRTYRITSYDGQSLPHFAVNPEPLYNLIHDGSPIQLFSHMVRFESDCFGNITAFSSASPDTVKVTPLF